MSTQQEEFWKGEFGDRYNVRAPGDVISNAAFFERALHKSGFDFASVIELGAGMGANLQALRRLMPKLQTSAIEINQRACEYLQRCGAVDVLFQRSILEEGAGRADLAFTKGVLIHIAPEDLPRAYAALHRSASRFVLVAEYYNPVPIEVLYRGHASRLWKRDFAGELLHRFSDLRLVDYGFAYHADTYPQDDLTWFLMEKSR